jgi:hypothetical protein
MTTTIRLTMPTIEQLWQELRAAGGPARQRRIDADHPHDLYADFAPPDQVGLLAICATQPRRVRQLRSVAVDTGVRGDGRWSLRLRLDEPRLMPVFGALCRDIIGATRSGVAEAQLAKMILDRLDRWRTLLERGTPGLGESTLRGLIGELLVLELYVIPQLALLPAVMSWTGPDGSAQDFLLPSGRRIEVKTIRHDAGAARINGLEQLDAQGDPLSLAIVRVQTTGPDAADAITAPMLIRRLRQRLLDDPDALVAFDAALGAVGWHEHASHDLVALRPMAIELHEVGPAFPRLLRGTVPSGIEDADYTITLPDGAARVWGGGE